MTTKAKLTHLGQSGEARMVDVSQKPATERIAVAEGKVVMRPETLDLVLSGDAKKGDVLGTARIAGIQAAKRTHELIPLCHPLALSKVEVSVEPALVTVEVTLRLAYPLPVRFPLKMLVASVWATDTEPSDVICVAAM